MRLLLAGVALLALAGCDLFGRDNTTIIVTGRAVTAMGSPIADLGVSLDRSARLGYVPEVITATDQDGRFSITHDPGDVNNLRTVSLNNEPYDSRYATYAESFVPGERRDLGDVDLSLPAAP